jgi:hypothetical protein
VLGRDQRSEIRDQTSQAPARGRTRCFSDLRHLIFDLRSANTAPPMLAHRLYAYPCPGPISSHRDDDRTCFTVTTRFTMSKGQRSEVGDQRSDRAGVRYRRRPSTSVLFQRHSDAPARTPPSAGAPSIVAMV